MSETFRVLHVVSKMSFGGVQAIIMNYYRNINRENIQFDFVVQDETEYEFNEEIKKLGGNIFFVSPMHVNRKKFEKQLSNILDENRYEVIHCHQNFLNIIPLRVAKKKRVKNRISHSHNCYKASSLLKGIQRIIFKKIISMYATHFYACSYDAGVWLYGSKLMNNKGRIINNAINIRKFAFNNNIRCQIRKELNIDNKYVLVHVGMFGEAKNHKYLIDIFKELEKINENSILLLIGEGELLNNIKNYAKGLNLENKILFLGKKANIDQYLMAADVFVFPSKYEGLPIALIEAQASGIPCIVSKEAVKREIDYTGNIEFISIKLHPKEWAQKIMHFQKTIRSPLPQNLIDRSIYNITVEANKLEKLYKEIM